MTISFDEQEELKNLDVDALLRELSTLGDDFAEHDSIPELDLSYLGLSSDDM